MRSAHGVADCVAQRTAMLLPPSARGDVAVAGGTMGVSLIATWPDVVAHAERLLDKELPRHSPPAVEARRLEDAALVALSRNASMVMQEMMSLGSTGLADLASEQFDEILLGLVAAAVVDDVRDSIVREGSGAPTSVVRRAQDYIRAHAADPIRLADLAHSLGVGMPALQIAFRRQLGASPREYLMSCRLELARARLVAADPDTRVSSVAFDCGFTLALFSRRYRQAFGELPSVTLRKR